MLQNVWDSSCCQESSASLLLDQQNLGRKEVGSDTWLVVMDHQGRRSRLKSSSATSRPQSLLEIFEANFYSIPSRQGKKTNQCHGTVALASSAPLWIIKIRISGIVSVKKGSFSSIFANLNWLVTSSQCKEHIRYLIFQSLTVLSAFSFFHFDKSSNICKNGNAAENKDLWTNWKKLKLGFWIPIIPNPSL